VLTDRSRCQTWSDADTPVIQELIAQQTAPIQKQVAAAEVRRPAERRLHGSCPPVHLGSPLAALQARQIQETIGLGAALNEQGAKVVMLQLELAELREQDAEKTRVIGSQWDAIAAVSAQVAHLTELCNTLARRAATQQEHLPAAQVQAGVNLATADCLSGLLTVAVWEWLDPPT
jgi:hypothetical protein